MKRWIATLAPLALLPATCFIQAPGGSTNSVSVALVRMPYVGERNTPELSGGPDYLQQGGIQKLLEERGFKAKQVSAVSLTSEEDKAYGAWNRLALANGDLAKLVSDERRGGSFPVGLLANCSSILGMLSGFSRDDFERYAGWNAGRYRQRIVPHAHAAKDGLRTGSAWPPYR